DPLRLARFPCATHPPAADREREVAGVLEEFQHRGIRHAPKLDRAKDPGTFVDAPIAAELPVLRLANRANHGPEDLRRAFGSGKASRNLVLQAGERLRTLSFGHVL